MSVDGFEQVSRIDAPAVVRAMAADGGPSVELVEALDGGAVGAWLVRWADGHFGVLTWYPPVPPGQPSGPFDTARRLMDIRAPPESRFRSTKPSFPSRTSESPSYRNE